MKGPFNPALVESFRQAKRRYYGNEGSLKRLIQDISSWKSAAREGKSEIFWIYRDYFAALTAEAVLSGDSGFFRRMEVAMKSEPVRPRVPEWEQCVFIVFEGLITDGRKIEKLDVQKAAMRFRAFVTMGLKGTLKRESIYAEYMFDPGPERMEKVIRKAIDAQREPVWTRILKRCGLGDLPKNSGRRPKGRQNSLH